MTTIELADAERIKDKKAKVLSMLKHPKAEDGMDTKDLMELYGISDSDMTTIVQELKDSGMIK